MKINLGTCALIRRFPREHSNDVTQIFLDPFPNPVSQRTHRGTPLEMMSKINNPLLLLSDRMS